MLQRIHSEFHRDVLSEGMTNSDSVPGTAIAPSPDNTLTIVAGGAVAVAGIAVAILWWQKKK